MARKDLHFRVLIMLATSIVLKRQARFQQTTTLRRYLPDRYPIVTYVPPSANDEHHPQLILSVVSRVTEDPSMQDAVDPAAQLLLDMVHGAILMPRTYLGPPTWIKRHPEHDAIYVGHLDIVRDKEIKKVSVWLGPDLFTMPERTEAEASVFRDATYYVKARFKKILSEAANLGPTEDTRWKCRLAQERLPQVLAEVSGIVRRFDPIACQLGGRAPPTTEAVVQELLRLDPPLD